MAALKWHLTWPAGRALSACLGLGWVRARQVRVLVVRAPREACQVNYSMPSLQHAKPTTACQSQLLPPAWKVKPRHEARPTHAASQPATLSSAGARASSPAPRNPALTSKAAAVQPVARVYACHRVAGSWQAVRLAVDVK